MKTEPLAAADGADAPVPWWTSCRVALAGVSSAGVLYMYILRQCLTIAMVCMVRDPTTHAPNHTDIDNATRGVNDTNPDAEEDCVWNSVNSRNNTGELEWDKTLRGTVLSAYYYGYIVTQIFGGYIAGRFGSKHVFGTAMLGALVCTLLIPVAARTHAYLGMLFPSSHAMWGRWAPPAERSRLVGFMYAALIPGIVISWSVSGLLCSVPVDNGWPLIFYIFGGTCVIWYISWLLLMYNSPDVHPRITAAERNYIMTSIGPGVYGKTRRKRTPWLQIATSPAVWAIITAHVSTNWLSYTIQTSIPLYMKEVLRFDVRQNGVFSALPYLVGWGVGVGCTVLADMLRARGVMTTLGVRRLLQSTAFLVPAVFMVALSYMDCTQRPLAVLFLTIAVAFISCNRAGYVINHVDIAPRYAGLLYGISNTFATIPGMVSPILVGYLTPNGTRREWQNVFFICAGVSVFGALVFGIFARGHEQSWAGGSNGLRVEVDDRGTPEEGGKGKQGEGREMLAVSDN